MKKTLNLFKSSAQELKSVQVLAICGVLLALRVVLGFLEVTIFTSYRISFSVLPVSLSAYMFGPVIGAIMGALGDLVTLIIKPTGAINFGILLSQALSGAIMGLFLYKRPISFKRDIFANVVTMLVCNIGLTTSSLALAYGKTYFYFLPGRALTCLILIPFHIAFLFGMQKLVKKYKLNTPKLT